MIPAFLLVSLAHAACPASVVALHGAALAGLDAWQQGNALVFEADLRAIQADAPCISDIVPPNDARMVHLLHAIQASHANDETGALWAFRGVVAVDPNYRLPDTVTNANGPLAKALEKARATEKLTEAMTGPGAWFVDGVSTESIPLERAAFVQVRATNGAITSWYVSGPNLPSDLARTLLMAASAPLNDNDEVGIRRPDPPPPPAPKPRPVVPHTVVLPDGAVMVSPPLFWTGSSGRDAANHDWSWSQVESMARLSPVGTSTVEQYERELARHRTRDENADVATVVGVVVGSVVAVGGIYGGLWGEMEVPGMPVVAGGLAIGLGTALVADSLRTDPPEPRDVIRAAMANVEASPVTEQAPQPDTAPPK